MPMVGQLSAVVLKEVLITSLIVHTAGRVEHLREYMEYTQKGSKNDWKRRFTSSDCQLLPLFIACSSGIRDASAAYLQRK